MTETALMDVFELCWDAMRDESFRCNGRFFNSEHCKIQDSTDTNFDVLENRLAYVYKYGCYNVFFFEKCFLNFLQNYPDLETVFPVAKLKVCSLSNGPGFDIIGLLCALCVSNKPLRSVPKFNAVNLYHSWSTLFKALIYKAYSSIRLKFPDYAPIKRGSIHLIQGDLFSTLSKEVKNCIRSSNVVLMVKVFFCSKASVNKFTKCLMKVFLLLKPGALIFFIGSEINMNSFSRRRFLSNYVKNVYGPEKVALDNIVINENYSNIVGQKPVHSGSAQFIVWQKRSPAEIEELIKESQVKGKKQNESKSSKRTRKKSVTLKEKTVDGDKSSVASDDNCSSDSEISYISRSRLSDVSTDELKSSSHSNLSDWTERKPKIPSDLWAPSHSNSSIQAIENIISILDTSDLEFVKKDDCKTDCFQQSYSHCYSDNASDLENAACKMVCVHSLNNDISVVNKASNLSDKDNRDIDLMKQTSSQVIDYNVSMINNTSCLSYTDNKDYCDLMKQEGAQTLDSGISVMNEASTSNYTKSHIDFYPVKQVSDNVLSVVNGASSLSYSIDKGCCDHGLIKQENAQILDIGMSLVKNASNLSCDDDLVSSSDHDILKQESSEVLMSVVNGASSLKYANEEDRCDLMKQESSDNCIFVVSDASSSRSDNDPNQETTQVLDNMSMADEAPSLNYAIDKGDCDFDPTKQESTQVLDNGLPAVNDTSSLSNADDKGCWNHDLMSQSTTQILDNGVPVIQDASSLSYGNDKDLMKKRSMQVLDDDMLVVNEALCANVESHCDHPLMKQTGAHNSDNGWDHDLRKQTTAQVLDNGVPVIQDASSLSYGNDKDLMKKKSMQVLDDDMLVVNEASSLSYSNNEESEVDLTKQENTQSLDMNGVNYVSSYAHDKDCCDPDLMKQTSVQVLNNGISATNDASNLIYVNDKDHYHLMKQESTQVLDDSMYLVNEVCSLKCANNEDRCNVDLMKQTYTLDLDANNVPIQLNESSSLNCANNKDRCCDHDLMKQATVKALDNSDQENSRDLNFMHVEFTHKNSKFPFDTQFTTTHEISTEKPTQEPRNITMQSRNTIPNEFREMNRRNEPESKSQQNLSLKQQSEGKNTTYPPEKDIKKSNEKVPNLHPLIRQCEHLVTEFEKLIISLKRDVHNSKKDSNCENRRQQQIIECSQFPHHCCVKIVHACCCRNRHNT